MLKFISTYRGCAYYQVTSGPMCGRQVRVHYWNEEFYKKDWNGGLHWNMSEEQYTREIVSGAGFIDYLCGPVTADVLEAINSAFESSTEQHRSDYMGAFRTGRYIRGQGWVVEEALQ